MDKYKYYLRAFHNWLVITWHLQRPYILDSSTVKVGEHPSVLTLSAKSLTKPPEFPAVISLLCKAFGPGMAFTYMAPPKVQ